MSALSALTIGLNLVLSILWAPGAGLQGIVLASATSFGAAFLISGALVLWRHLNDAQAIQPKVQSART
jgi:hypothetical protein